MEVHRRATGGDRVGMGDAYSLPTGTRCQRCIWQPSGCTCGKCGMPCRIFVVAHGYPRLGLALKVVLAGSSDSVAFSKVLQHPVLSMSGPCHRGQMKTACTIRGLLVEDHKLTRYFKYQTHTHILEGGEPLSHMHPVLRQWTTARCCTYSFRDLPLCVRHICHFSRAKSPCSSH
jgi:hypothetical protein